MPRIFNFVTKKYEFHPKEKEGEEEKLPPREDWKSQCCPHHENQHSIKDQLIICSECPCENVYLMKMNANKQIDTSNICTKETYNGKEYFVYRMKN